MTDQDAVAELEQAARALVDDGRATRDVQLALDQLVADRSNGEPLEVAIDRLRAVLGDHGLRGE